MATVMGGQQNWGDLENIGKMYKKSGGDMSIEKVKIRKWLLGSFWRCLEKNLHTFYVC